MNKIICPSCGSEKWNAVEQFQALVPCEITRGADGGVEVEFDPMAELSRDAASSVTTLYICGGPAECGFSIEASKVGDLPGGQRHGDQ